MAKDLESKPLTDRLDRSRKILEGQAVEDEPPQQEQPATKEMPNQASQETGGPSGPDPTRYGDWEKKGRCIDF